MEALLLAAGEAKRMGMNKLILLYKGKPIIIHALSSALESSNKVVLVTGCYEKEVITLLKEYHLIDHPHLHIIHNPNYTMGQFSSTLLGLEEISPSSSCAIALSDAPLITPSHYQLLQDHLRTYDGVRVFYHTTPGHPMLIGERLVELAKHEDVKSSMRNFLQDKHIKVIQSSDPSWVTDIDTPEAYKKLSCLVQRFLSLLNIRCQGCLS
jgi:molybdenum cofactor cytidylyltransferase